jgi:hypothetical protein
LQLLKGKLYDQFFSEMKNGGMLPFMDPEIYGRPLMECSSFIASSAFPDPSIVGQGFLARLSGSTAEFLDMWKVGIFVQGITVIDQWHTFSHTAISAVHVYRADTILLER